METEEIIPPVITRETAKYVLRKMFETGKQPFEIIGEEELWSMDFLTWCREHTDFVRQMKFEWLRDECQKRKGKWLVSHATK